MPRNRVRSTEIRSEPYPSIGVEPAEGGAGLLSVLMPLFNEEELVATSLNRVLAAPLPEAITLEVIVVDDGSTDRSPLIVEDLAREHPAIVLLRHAVNRGKGEA